MRRVLATEHGHAIYRQRKETIEPVFGHTKHNRGFRQFRRRGRSAVRSEWRLMAATHNLLKLHNHHLAAVPARDAHGAVAPKIASPTRSAEPNAAAGFSRQPQIKPAACRCSIEAPFARVGRSTGVALWAVTVARPHNEPAVAVDASQASRLSRSMDPVAPMAPLPFRRSSPRESRSRVGRRLFLVEAVAQIPPKRLPPQRWDRHAGIGPDWWPRPTRATGRRPFEHCCPTTD
jgi:Transposase DDE domain